MPIKSAKICFISNNFVSVMKESAELSLTSSMSFILSLTEYLENKIKLKPPNLKSYLANKLTSELEAHLLNPQQCDYFEAWGDYLFGLIVKGKILRANDQILFVTSVSEDYFKDNLSNNPHFQTEALITTDNFDLRSHVKDSLHQENLTQMPKHGKKIAIINFSASVANVDKLKPKLHIEGLYAGQLYRFGDEWESYRILNSQIPTVEQMNKQDVLILTGSTYSVTNMRPEMRKFGRNLLRVLDLNKKLKIIATCFGHQFLGHLHGAAVRKRNFVKGPQRVSFDRQNQRINVPYLQHILNRRRGSLKLFEYHNDHICQVPKGFVKVGESDSCGVESLVSTDKRIWTFQFHPQYTEQYIKSYEQRSAIYNKDESGRAGKGKVDKEHHESHEIFRNAVRKFIDWLN